MKENTAQVVAQMPVDVATFLLNEKRQDVLTIETRFKVNVLLVPNRHLETPNYTIERLRHEDLNQAEPLPLSFDMVKQPEQIDFARQKKEEAATPPRQEAMVKGITPAQPAPIPVERPATPMAATPTAPSEGSWLTRVMSWFTAKPEAPAAAPAPARRDSRGEARADDRPRDGRRDGRSGDSRNGDSRDRKRGDNRNDARRGGDQRRDEPRDGNQANRRDRDPRGDKRPGERGEQRPEGARPPRDGKPQGDARRDGNRPPREPREGGKPPREPRGEPALVADTVSPAGIAPNVPPQNEAGGEAREGNRRRRGRRGRGGDRPEGAAGPGDNGAVQDEHAPKVGDALSMADTSEAGASDSLPQAQEARAPREPRPSREPRQPREQREPRAPREQPEPPAAQVSPVPQDPPHAATASLFDEASAPSAPVARARPADMVKAAPPQPLPPIALTLPPESGLELVETRFTAPATFNEAPEPPRPKRVRPPRVEIPSEPLEIVETAKGAVPPAN